MNRKIQCQKCFYYSVTWLNGQSHSCKAYGFKSKIIPSSVVRNTSGKDCVFYIKKPNTK